MNTTRCNRPVNRAPEGVAWKMHDDDGSAWKALDDAGSRWG